MEKTDRQIYEEFVSQLCQWGETGVAPSAGNQDIGYGLTLQRRRLETHYAKIEYRLTGRLDRQGQADKAAFSDLVTPISWSGRRCTERRIITGMGKSA